MADVLTKSQRSYVMSRIRSRDTMLELLMRKKLRGYRFSYQPKGILGKPDFANKKMKIVIFVDGCFWHGCKIHYKTPKSNVAFWTYKIERNMARDKWVGRKLRSDGWKVIRLWEHDLHRKTVL